MIQDELLRLEQEFKKEEEREEELKKQLSDLESRLQSKQKLNLYYQQLQQLRGPNPDFSIFINENSQIKIPIPEEISMKTAEKLRLEELLDTSRKRVRNLITLLNGITNLDNVLNNEQEKMKLVNEYLAAYEKLQKS